MVFVKPNFALRINTHKFFPCTLEQQRYLLKFLKQYATRKELKEFLDEIGDYLNEFPEGEYKFSPWFSSTVRDRIRLQMEAINELYRKVYPEEV